MITEKDLGKTFVDDKITGFKGVATGFCYYISGCNQVCLSGKVTDAGEAKHVWIDVQRLVEVEDVEQVILKNEITPGFDHQPPVR